MSKFSCSSSRIDSASENLPELRDNFTCIYIHVYYVCVYICMYICMHTYIYVCM